MIPGSAHRTAGFPPRRPGEQRLGLHLTDRCQLDCDHCLRDPEVSPKDLPLGVIRSVLAEARQIYDIRHVSLTGGEPILHPEFEAIVDAIATVGMGWDLVTNGFRFHKLVEWITPPHRRSSFAQAVFSIDGPDEASHDAIRGQGSFRAVVGATALARLENLPFGVQVTLHARNAHQLESLGIFAAQLGAEHVSFAMMQPTGTPLDTNFWLSAHDWREIYERIQSLSSVLRIQVIAPEGWPDAQPMALCGPLRGNTLHVDVEGRLSLCCLHSGIPGGGGAEIAGSVGAGLRAPHEQLLIVQQRALRAKLERAWSKRDAWSDFGCNACLATFDKPHWTDAGVSGPTASRERWQGAWARTSEGKRVLRVL